MTEEHRIRESVDSSRRQVRRLLEMVEYDEVRGVIRMPSPVFGLTHKTEEFSNIGELKYSIREFLEASFSALVARDDSGKPLHDDHVERANLPAVVDGIISKSLNYDAIENFFRHLKVDDSAEEIFRSNNTILPEASKIVRIDLESINEELVQILARKPQLMRQLDPRKFEELIAELMKDRGYNVEITQKSKDGGRDILAIRRNDVGQALTLIECKRYAEGRPVGVEIVRGLYGVVTSENATKGMIATTSYFTKGAMDFRDKVPYRLDLAGFDNLTSMLANYRKMAKPD